MTYSQANRNLNSNEAMPASMDCSSWVAKMVKDTFGIPVSEFGGNTLQQFAYLKKNAQVVGQGQEQHGDFVAYGNSGTSTRHIAIVSGKGMQIHMSSSKSVNGGRGGVRESAIQWNSKRGTVVYRLNFNGQAQSVPASKGALNAVAAAGQGAAAGGGAGAAAGGGGSAMADGTVSAIGQQQSEASSVGSNSVGNLIGSITGSPAIGKIASSLMSGITSSTVGGGKNGQNFNNVLKQISTGQASMNSSLVNSQKALPQMFDQLNKNMCPPSGNTLPPHEEKVDGSVALFAGSEILSNF
jgi:hypothetical protein